MNVIVFLLVGLICFGLLTFCRRWHDFFVLMAVAIGSACNTLVYNSFSNPVKLGNFVFSIDSLLLVLFAFTLIITLRDYGFKEFKTMSITSLVAIAISGTIELFANAISSGEFNGSTLSRYMFWMLVTLGLAVGTFVMSLLYKTLKTKKVNMYLNFAVCIFFFCLVSRVFYYVASYLHYDLSLELLLNNLVGSLIAKAYCVLLGCISYLINHSIWHSRNN